MLARMIQLSRPSGGIAGGKFSYETRANTISSP